MVCLLRATLSPANWYGVKVQRNVTLLHRSKTTIRGPIHGDFSPTHDFFDHKGIEMKAMQSHFAQLRGI